MVVGSTTKLCTKCKVVKPRSEFYARKQTADGCQSHCKGCVGKWRKEDYSKRPYVRAQQNAASKKYNRELRQELIIAYGAACACCGETELKFLSIDHVNGGGQQHRERIGEGGAAIARFLKHNGYPKDDYQLLCFNCNCAKGFFGECPHKTQQRAAAASVGQQLLLF